MGKYDILSRFAADTRSVVNGAIEAARDFENSLRRTGTAVGCVWSQSSDGATEDEALTRCGLQREDIAPRRAEFSDQLVP
jgi:hypothetical protein